MTLVQGKCCPDLLRAVLSGQTEGFNGTIRLRPPVDLSLFPGVKYLRLTNQVATFRGLDLETIIQLTNTDGVLMVSKAKMLKLCQRNRLLK